MEEIRINRLPLLTYRYLHTNDTKVDFEAPKNGNTPAFSDISYVSEGGRLPDFFRGASPETVKALEKGSHYTITIPAGVKADLTITLSRSMENPDFAAAFLFKLEEGADLNLIYRMEGKYEGTSLAAAYYELDKNANLKVSRLVSGLKGAKIFDQRHTVLSENAKADFTAAELGGENIYIHSFGRLEGDHSQMFERALYAGKGRQHLDFFYHIDHVGKKTKAEIDVKGALDDTSKKIFRGTLDFKKGCSGSVGDEGDYAIQLAPKTKNISLPLLLCTEDDVQGNHASSAGQLDENTIYFLMSRGFSLEEARRIVIEALIRPIIDQMDESVREEVLRELREKLDSKEIK